MGVPMRLRPLVSRIFEQSARRPKFGRRRPVRIRRRRSILIEAKLGDVADDAGVNADDSADAPPVTQADTPL